jgi:choline dehydrogenase
VIATRPNYHLLPSTAVSKILFKGKKAVGVEYMTLSTGAIANVTATKEVVLAAGAVHNPQILLLSGVGPKTTLDKFNISTVLNLPGVGTNFQDHLDLAVVYNCKSHGKKTELSHSLVTLTDFFRQFHLISSPPQTR